jgi:hypothetical protein
MSNGLQELRTAFSKVLISILWAIVAVVTGIAMIRGQAPLLRLESAPSWPGRRPLRGGTIPPVR